MKIKNILVISLVSILMVFSFSGCETVGNGQGSKEVNKSFANVTQAESAVADNVEERIETIGEFSYGTNVALTRIYSLPTFSTLSSDFKLYLDAAMQTNNYVRKLAPSPSAQKMLEMEEFIKKLTSDVEKEKKIAFDQSVIYEAKVTSLNIIALELKSKLEEANNSFKQLTFSLGEKVDNLSADIVTEKAKTAGLKVELNKFDDGFGWYAIKHGIGIFLKKIMWITIGFGFAFLILKIFASSNPIAGAIFSVFESIVGFFIKGIFNIFPKAVRFSGNIDLPTFQTVKSSRDKIVDTMESLYRIEKATPGKVYTLSEVFDEFEKTMNDRDKEEVKLALKKLGWDG